MPIVPVVLCGGSGLRLWPLSREGRPKQLLPLATDHSLLEDTLRRCDHLESPVLIGGDDQRFLLAEAVRRAGRELQIIAEPRGKNTAAAALVAALYVQELMANALVLLIPSDHRVGDQTAFQEAISRGTVPANNGHIVVFGMAPDRPATGYGYIRPGEEVFHGAYQVDAFEEKPSRSAAEHHLSTGHLWNAGMFLFRPDVMIGEFRRFSPELFHGVDAALRRAHRSDSFVRLDPSSWETLESVALDTAIMEKTAAAVVVPATIDWTDLGGYDALFDLHRGGENAEVGDVVSLDSRGCYLHGEDILVAVAGIEDLVVVGTRDAVMVTPRSAAPDLKRLVQKLGNRKQVREHPRAERPWGTYRVVDSGRDFQVKRITIAPGQSLSLQRHQCRAEHWLIVSGRARVEVDGLVKTLHRGGHVAIGVGQTHRLTNDTTEVLELIEVQLGDYLGEDDIERLKDDYGRCEQR